MLIESTDFKTILEQRIHHIKLKPQGLIDLTVKLPEVKIKKVKPLLLPRPKCTHIKNVNLAQSIVAQVIYYIIYFPTLT